MDIPAQCRPTRGRGITMGKRLRSDGAKGSVQIDGRVAKRPMNRVSGSHMRQFCASGVLQAVGCCRAPGPAPPEGAATIVVGAGHVPGGWAGV